MRLALVLALLVGCMTPTPPIHDGAPPPADVGTDAERVVLEGAWARAVPPGTPNSAVFGTLVNPAQATVRVTGAASPAAGSAEVHTHTMVDGVMQMRQVDGLDVPGGGRLELKPGGDHLMLIGLAQPLVEGETVRVTLSFGDGSTSVHDVPVERRDAAPAGGSPAPEEHGGHDAH